ncbi:MAG: right-handed parallel beta-helix repeat-containing protein [bacterium]|nr:right-handed parallel beta-helix repeat-containing protein [bacterium]
MANYTSPKPVFDQCVFYDNSAVYGGAVYLSEDTTFFYHCTFALNRATEYGGEMYCWSPSVISGCIFAFSSNSGLMIDNTWDQNATIEYCDFYGNANGNIRFWSDDSTLAAPGLGQLSMLNANGDSCDVYHNLFNDPLFADTAARDLHLTAASTCIDAASPSRPHDPDGTVADIGAYPFGDVVLPGPPGELVAHVVGGMIELRWKRPTGSPPGVQYDLKASASSDGPYAFVSTTTDTMVVIDPATIADDRQFFVVCSRP